MNGRDSKLLRKVATHLGFNKSQLREMKRTWMGFSAATKTTLRPRLERLELPDAFPYDQKS